MSPRDTAVVALNRKMRPPPGTLGLLNDHSPPPAEKSVAGLAGVTDYQEEIGALHRGGRDSVCSLGSSGAPLSAAASHSRGLGVGQQPAVVTGLSRIQTLRGERSEHLTKQRTVIS